MAGNRLALKIPLVWDCIDAAEKEVLFRITDEYKVFLDAAKTERMAVREIILRAEKAGFRPLVEGEVIEPGARIYCVNKGKNVALIVLGEEPLEKGINFIGSHLDSPRLDIKQRPLYEQNELVLAKTHYYGLLKKYQWVALPLCLTGVVVKENGEAVFISIGDEEGDPVFYITDLLPHLGGEQSAKKLGEAFPGEILNVVLGSVPSPGESEERIKAGLLELLQKKYGFCEEDFISAELQVVPAGKARDVGFDRSMITAYGQDDKIGSFASLQAMLSLGKCRRTAVALYVDKEEIGNIGESGIASSFFENVLTDLLVAQGAKDSHHSLRKLLAHSNAISADVTPGIDPDYPGATDPFNSAILGKGVTIAKYTGTNGKENTADASAEYIGRVKKLLKDNDIQWQTSEFGACDAGGAFTIAYVMANKNMNVLDMGIPLLSMHAPFELAHKGDIYMACKAYKAFLAQFE